MATFAASKTDVRKQGLMGIIRHLILTTGVHLWSPSLGSLIDGIINGNMGLVFATPGQA